MFASFGFQHFNNSSFLCLDINHKNGRTMFLSLNSTKFQLEQLWILKHFIIDKCFDSTPVSRIKFIKIKLQKIKSKKATSEDVNHQLSNTQTSYRPEFLQLIIDVEGGLFLEAYDSPEGGNPTIAVGHKLQDNELSMLSVSVQQGIRLFIEDVEKAEKAVINFVQSKGIDYASLSHNQKELLIDFSFNLGPTFHQKFPNFVRGVLTNDHKLMNENYRRMYRGIGKDGVSQLLPLKDRNKKIAIQYGFTIHPDDM
eukprot:403349468